MIILNGGTDPQIALQEALNQCAAALVDAVVLLYSPSCCQLGKFEGGLVKDSHNNAVNLLSVFEARAFNETYELRWLNARDGEGQAVLLWQDDEGTSHLKEPLPALEALDTIQQPYLLWGEGIGLKPELAEGWSRLATARIGAMDVPLAGVQRNERVYLWAREYLQVYDEHGNVVVAEERLLKLKRIKEIKRHG